jgi:hypothetical protein
MDAVHDDRPNIGGLAPMVDDGNHDVVIIGTREPICPDSTWPTANYSWRQTTVVGDGEQEAICDKQRVCEMTSKDAGERRGAGQSPFFPVLPELGF